MTKKHDVSEDVISCYSHGTEENRLFCGSSQVERVRTENILHRFLPKAPAAIVDIGGAAGAYALPLARQGYQVYLIDVVPLHIEQAKEAEKQQKDHPLSASMVGDARNVDLPDSMADCVLLFGPLYHLPDKNDRIKALSEAYRILKPGGLLFAVGITRFASFLNGMIYGMLKDPIFLGIVKEDIKTGHHRNPTENVQYFTTAYFHQPDELKNELVTSGFKNVSVLGVEGPGWLMPEFDTRWNDNEEREILLSLLEMVETEQNLLGANSHIMALGKK